MPFYRRHFETHALDSEVFHSNIIFPLVVQLILCHQWFRYWFYAKQTLLPEQIRIEFFLPR